jgi:hypothetical protein
MTFYFVARSYGSCSVPTSLLRSILASLPRSILASLLHYVLTSFSHRKQQGFGRRGIGNFLELRILAAKRFRHFHFRALQNVDELQGVDHRFALKMIVGDDKSFAGPLGDFADSRNPGRELFRRVKIVVALMRWDGFVVGEPSVVPAAVQPHVAYRRRGLRGGPKRAPDDRLVDVAETDAVIAQEFQGFGRIPRTVAHFDYQRVVRETFYQGGEVRNRFRRAMKRKRELQQDGAELLCCKQHVEACANGALLFRGRAGRHGLNIVREALPEFGGKDKPRIRRHAIEPLRGILRTQRLVKRSVDLDGIKVFREIGGLVESFSASRWIDVAGPVGIRPARWSHANYAGRRGSVRP